MSMNPQALNNGQEQYEPYPHPDGGEMFCQYGYRHTDGELFSCIGNCLDACRARRDAWLRNRKVTVTSTNHSPKCKGPTPADREKAYVKLRFLSTVIGGIGERFDKGEMDDDDMWAIEMLIVDVAHQIFPEWKEAQP